MDKLTHYRQVVRRLIEEYASWAPSHGEIESEAIIDPQHDHYEVLRVGWSHDTRVHGCIMHVDIRDGKIWIQYDGTDRPFADELLAAGVPPEDIVLAFHPAELRQYTGFGVG